MEVIVLKEKQAKEKNTACEIVKKSIQDLGKINSTRNLEQEYNNFIYYFFGKHERIKIDPDTNQGPDYLFTFNDGSTIILEYKTFRGGIDTFNLVKPDIVASGTYKRLANKIHSNQKDDYKNLYFQLIDRLKATKSIDDLNSDDFAKAFSSNPNFKNEIIDDTTEVLLNFSSWQITLNDKLEKWSKKNPIISKGLDKFVIGILVGVIASTIYTGITKQATPVRVEPVSTCSCQETLPENTEVAIIEDVLHYYKIIYCPDGRIEVEGYVSKRSIQTLR